MSYNVSTASKTNAPVFMIDRANQFLLNQNYLVVEKTLDTSKKEFQWGWRGGLGSTRLRTPARR